MSWRYAAWVIAGVRAGSSSHALMAAWISGACAPGIERGAPVRRIGRVVVHLDLAARKDVVAAGELVRRMALREEYLDAGMRVAQEDERGSRNGGDGFDGHAASVTRSAREKKQSDPDREESRWAPKTR